MISSIKQLSTLQPQMPTYEAKCIMILIFALLLLKVSALPPIVKIGAIFREDQKDSTSELAFKYAVHKINKEKSILPKTKLIYDIQYVFKDDSFHASKRVCSQIKMGVQAIFGPSDNILGAHIHSICDALDIPHLEWRLDLDKGIKEFSINLYPSQPLLNAAFQDTMRFLNWTKCAIITEEHYGLIKLRELMKTPGIEIVVRQADPSTYNTVLKEIKSKEINNLIIDTNPENINEFLKGIIQQQMTEYKYHYFFTSFDIESFDMEDFKYNFVNITSFRLVDVGDISVRELLKDMERYYFNQNINAFNKTRIIETEAALIYDSVYGFSIGLQNLEQSHMLKFSNVSCADEIPWDGGLSLINYINAVEWKGMTGPISFKEGRRVLFKLDLVKLKHGMITKVGEWSPSIGLNITDYDVFFDTSNMNFTLVVITILEIPYVMLHYGKNYTGNSRFYGFCVDILDRVSQEVGFNYILKTSPDSRYGAKDSVTQEWNGMVYELMRHEKPYVMLRKPAAKKASSSKYVSGSSVNQTGFKAKPYGRFLKILNPGYNSDHYSYTNYYNDSEDYMRQLNNEDINDHYEGFCIDLLKMVATKIGFEYRIQMVGDGKYGARDPITLEWNGIIKELMQKSADLAVGSMTINYARESVIDFTKPFMNLGISILFKVPTSQPTRLFSFMNPLAIEIWFYVFVAYCLVSLTMYVVARFSPYEWQNPHHPCELENDVTENQFSVSNSFWFAIGTLMQQGSDLNPKATSTRIVGGIWWFFTLIIISSYTANLAAFLTVERMITPIENADDLAGQTEISYGTLESGSTMTFFRDSMIETYKKMWRFMENKKPSVFVSTYEDGIKRVLEGNYAFLMESTMLDYVVQRDCNLTQIGGLLDTKGYGIATPKGSIWRDKISLAILELQEKGEIQMLYDKWWKNPGDTCMRQDKAKESKANGHLALGVDNIGGVFVVLLCGLALAVLISIIEFCIRSKQDNFTDPLNIVKNRQSLCAEMTEEFCFALSCRGTRQKPALKRQCSKCANANTINKFKESRSQYNMSSLTDYSNVGVELGAHTNSIDADIDYCCPNAKPPIVFHTPQHSETQQQQRRQSYFDFENSLKNNYVAQSLQRVDRSSLAS